jgi:hypothetical protein
VELVNNLRNVKLLICWNELVLKYIHVKTKFLRCVWTWSTHLQLLNFYFQQILLLLYQKNWEIFVFLV